MNRQTMRAARALAVIALVIGAALTAPVAAGAAPGDLDPTFSDDGFTTTHFGGQSAVANDMAIDSQGRIVAAGENYGGRRTHDNIALARYLPNGAPDPSFSGDGKLQTSFTFQESAKGVAIDSQGRIITAGALRSGAFFLARFLPNGRWDHSFSGDGRSKLNVGWSASDVALDEQGRIVAVGGGPDHDGSDLIVVRLNPDGSLDRSFHSNGRIRIEFGESEFATSVAIDSLGRIVVGGYRLSFGSSDRFALARLLPNGSLDASFSGDGRQTTRFGPLEDPVGEPRLESIAIDERNRVVAAGYGYVDGNTSIAVARYRGDGSPDPSFSGDGKTLTAFGGLVYGFSAAVDLEGRIVVAGPGPSGGLKLVRYQRSGDLDNTFGDDGRVETDFPDGRPHAVAIDSQGRIVGAGLIEGEFGAVRFLGGP